jgi:hypothetical protein
MATTLGVPLAEVQAWEAGEQFPTKRWVDRLRALHSKGPEGILRKAPKSEPRPISAMSQLDNPELWLLVRKLLAYPELFSKAAKLAAPYEDPAAAATTE